MKITLPDGLIVEGSPDQINSVLKRMGYDPLEDSGKYYLSSSKGLMLIEDMNTTHLRNAILKFYETWVKDLHRISNPQVLVKKITSGIDDKTWLAMIKEYYTRRG